MPLKALLDGQPILAPLLGDTARAARLVSLGTPGHVAARGGGDLFLIAWP